MAHAWKACWAQALEGSNPSPSARYSLLQSLSMKSATPYFIFVTGGVLSGVGKGITAASIGAVLKSRGLKVTIQKCDPYLNVDAGTLNPSEHGECYVTKDGAETDLDLGHYERFLDEEMTQASATLAGRLLLELIEDERAGKFLGKTLQMVPHFTNKIQDAIAAAGSESDIHIVEIGGTVGDYESTSFMEAIREFAMRRGRAACQFVHVVYVPYLAASKEFKTKPAQNAIRDLREFGIIPDVIVARTERAGGGFEKKLSLYGGVPREAVITLTNARTVYQVPGSIAEAGIDQQILDSFGITAPPADLTAWDQVVAQALGTPKQTIKIGIVAKYLDNEDTYFSVIEALKAAAWSKEVGLEYEWVNAVELETDGCDVLASYDALVVTGGFGIRGIEGKIAAADYAYRHKIPYLGLCLGLQVAVIASARRGGVKKAMSTECDPAAKDDVVYIMADQKGKEATGGTMRLGNYPAKLQKDSLVAKLYGAEYIVERHRHRYEVNRVYESAITKGGLTISGQSPDGTLVEFIEAPDHPYYVATQAHPEFRSRPTAPHPLFVGLIIAALNHQ